MPRFYFDVHDGEDVRDTIGTVLPDLGAAQVEAVKVSGELLRDLGGKFWGGGGLDPCRERCGAAGALHAPLLGPT
jgi:hypothetical protein